MVDGGAQENNLYTPIQRAENGRRNVFTNKTTNYMFKK